VHHSRREILKLAGAFAIASGPRVLTAQQQPTVLDAGGVNLIAFSAPEGTVLVDSGPHGIGVALGSKVQTLFNTHYHLDQTGNNEAFGAAGAKIIAQARTREWMSSD
jgi:glyoxylase-like metal-dependent hydrolase (beta-lactamase superfamily II)